MASTENFKTNDCAAAAATTAVMCQPHSSTSKPSLPFATVKDDRRTHCILFLLNCFISHWNVLRQDCQPTTSFSSPSSHPPSWNFFFSCHFNVVKERMWEGDPIDFHQTGTEQFISSSLHLRCNWFTSIPFDVSFLSIPNCHYSPLATWSPFRYRCSCRKCATKSLSLPSREWEGRRGREKTSKLLIVLSFAARENFSIETILCVCELRGEFFSIVRSVAWNIQCIWCDKEFMQLNTTYGSEQCGAIFSRNPVQEMKQYYERFTMHKIHVDRYTTKCRGCVDGCVCAVMETIKSQRDTRMLYICVCVGLQMKIVSCYSLACSLLLNAIWLEFNIVD